MIIIWMKSFRQMPNVKCQTSNVGAKLNVECQTLTLSVEIVDKMIKYDWEWWPPYLSKYMYRICIKVYGREEGV